MNKSLFLVVLLSALVGSLATMGTQRLLAPAHKDKNQELIKEFYAVENATHVSPHGIRKQMDQGGSGILLVDLRSAQEYEREHIIGAVNIPAYSDPDNSAYDEVDRIVGQFRDLIKANPGKEIVTYCYSIPCMTGRKVGKMLVEHDIYVKTLGIGWNEWRHFWTLWNHEHEWGTTKPEDYVRKGKEPGVPVKRAFLSPCGEGQFGC